MKRLFQIRVIRYGFAGALGAMVQIGLLYLLGQTFHVWYLLASIIAYVFSVSISFIIQKFWTFDNRATERIHVQFSAYVAIFLVNLVLNTLLMHFLVEKLSIWYVLSQAIACILIAIPSFFLYKYLIFRNRETY